MKLPPIAIYCSSGSWGGLEMNTARLANWLHKRGHLVTLFCLKESPLAKEAETNHIPYSVASRNKRYFDLPGAFFISRKLSRLKIKFLILVDNHDLDFGGIVKLLSGNRIRLIYQQHMRLGIPKKDPVHTLRFRQLDAWITLLPYMKEEVLDKTRYPPTRIHLVPLGLDVETIRSGLPSKQQARKAFGLPDDRPLIGILGRLDPQKGQHLVIEALQVLKNQGEVYNLLIMGEATMHEGESYQNRLRDMVTTLELDNQVYFRGYQQEVSPFYGAIDLFVMGSYWETYGMVTIEAMLCRVPVVGSNAGGTTELLENGTYGWLYRPKDPVDMAAMINQVFADRVNREQVVARAEQYALTTFSHKKECDQIEELLRSLI
ncbi:MAG: glycosyltransferase family 4 protein [Bacteroidota bacterium]